MTLRLGNLDDDARYGAWVGIVERIYHEHVSYAWRHFLFRQMRAVFWANRQLSEEGGFLLQWMVENYVDAALMLVRRELDRQAGTESLVNLLFDMIEHSMIVSRSRYKARWRYEDAHALVVADRSFDRFHPIRVSGNPDADHLDAALVKADVDKLTRDAEALREYAERTRAHRTPPQKIDTTEMTFKVLHDTISDVRTTIAKYYALLTLKSIARWEPFPQYDTLAALAKPWMIDRASVMKAMEETPGDTPPEVRA